MKISRTNYLLVLLILSFMLASCATTATLSQSAHERKPLIMSGVRLDLASLRSDANIKERFGVSPPNYPLLDLPFSFVLDFVVLGYTLPVALYYKIR